MQSKKGVAASIEQQEAGNERLRAQGEDRLQTQIMAEKQRIQNINISEGAREQQYQAAGRRFEFESQEKRDVNKLSRLYGQQTQATQARAAAMSQENSAIMGGINALGNFVGAFGKTAAENSGGTGPSVLEDTDFQNEVYTGPVRSYDFEGLGVDGLTSNIFNMKPRVFGEQSGTN